MLAATDGAVLISSDLGKTFARHAAASAPLAALWGSPTGAVYGVGSHGEIVISTDRGKTFRATHEGDADLAAITGCGNDLDRRSPRDGARAAIPLVGPVFDNEISDA